MIPHPHMMGLRITEIVLPPSGHSGGRDAGLQRTTSLGSTDSETDDKSKSTKGASKQRRDLINSEIGNLRDLLPLPESTRQRLSQLQIMSLCCVYIRKCNYFSRLFGSQSFKSETPFEFSQSMNGFLLTATRDGKLLHISENVTEYLGHSMVDMLTQGDSIYDIVDKRDHSGVQAHLLHTPFSATPGAVSEEKAFFCRMNVSRSFRRQAGFGDHKVMHVRGHFVSPLVRDHFGDQPVFTALCSPLVTPDVKETVTQNNTMIYRTVHGLDMKYIEMATNGEHHLGYTDEEMKGRSWYELLHPDDIAEAKEKHMQLIKSSHEMGCMLTVRLMSKSAQWVWLNIVMHIRQPFPGDNADPAVVCINHVIQEQEAQGFKLQSQLYSSHIARSPELFSSPSGGSPTHTITQVPTGESSQGEYQQGGQPEQGPSSYQGEGSSYRLTTLSSSSSNPQPGMQRESTSSESGSDDQKQVLRADVLSRLKRKMSESGSPQCKPVKLPKYSEQDGGRGISQQQPMSFTGNVSLAPLSGSDSFLDSAFNFSSGGVCDAPVFVQLQDQISLNPKEQLLISTDSLHLPLSPLTPSSYTSEVSNQSDFNTSLSVDVSDVAVVPASFLTPDCSPASSPSSKQPLTSIMDIASLDDISIFSEESSTKPVEIKQERQLPEIDLGTLEKYFVCLQPSLPSLNLLSSEDMVFAEQEIKQEVIEEEEVCDVKEEEEDLISMCQSLLEMPVTIGGVECSDPVLSATMEDDDLQQLPPNHHQLIHEIDQLNQMASPSYGEEELESALFNSTL